MTKDEIIPVGEPTLERRVGEGSASETVVRAVADALGRDPLDLPPIYETLDPDALDELFADSAADTSEDAGHLEFEYCDCTVVLSESETVIVAADD